ncbi:Sporulation kinase A [Enhygromyxa salina]|uniref:histidine kinase n=1 Tax=Enhygromyxa salina TaxID=215803 RepID=A0A2S9YDW8_9BACT|nr:Sporulation kinase A [Enhygromyxa salina]
MVVGTWVVATVGLYFNAIHEQGMAMIICLPVAVTAWVFGFRGALLAAAVALPLGLGILTLGSLDVGDVLREPSMLVGHVMTALLGLVIGYLSTLRGRLERETQLRAQSERAAVEAEMGAHLARADRLAIMGTLASGVAHEINNPLTYLLSNLEFAQDDLLQLRDAEGVDPKLWERLRIGIDESREAVERIHKITSELQLFVRDHPGTLRFVDMVEALGASIKLARHKLRDGTEVEARLEPVPMVRGDGGKLTQVFVNLLVNAAQAIPEGRGHGRIVVTLGLERVEETSILVTVSDDGQGMSAEVVSKIFEPFFTTKPRGVGTGLGLSVSASIIRNHGGELECDSEPGRGTTFRVRLPTFGDAAVSVTPSEAASPPPNPQPRVAQSLTAVGS